MATAEVIYPLAGKKVWVAGHRGMVGGALVRRLAREGCAQISLRWETSRYDAFGQIDLRGARAS